VGGAERESAGKSFAVELVASASAPAAFHYACFVVLSVEIDAIRKLGKAVTNCHSVVLLETLDRSTRRLERRSAQPMPYRPHLLPDWIQGSCRPGKA
jgi:hypothetical protein